VQYAWRPHVFPEGIVVDLVYALLFAGLNDPTGAARLGIEKGGALLFKRLSGLVAQVERSACQLSFQIKSLTAERQDLVGRRRWEFADIGSPHKESRA